MLLRMLPFIDINLNLSTQLQVPFLAEQVGRPGCLHCTYDLGLLLFVLEHFLQLLFLDPLVSILDLLLGPLVFLFQQSEFATILNLS